MDAGERAPGAADRIEGAAAQVRRARRRCRDAGRSAARGGIAVALGAVARGAAGPSGRVTWAAEPARARAPPARGCRRRDRPSARRHRECPRARPAPRAAPPPRRESMRTRHAAALARPRRRIRAPFVGVAHGGRRQQVEPLDAHRLGQRARSAPRLSSARVDAVRVQRPVASRPRPRPHRTFSLNSGNGARDRPSKTTRRIELRADIDDRDALTGVPAA